MAAELRFIEEWNQGVGTAKNGAGPSFTLAPNHLMRMAPAAYDALLPRRPSK